jgi:hypothetical protein
MQQAVVMPPQTIIFVPVQMALAPRIGTKEGVSTKLQESVAGS